MPRPQERENAAAGNKEASADTRFGDRSWHSYDKLLRLAQFGYPVVPDLRPPAGHAAG